MLALPLNFHMLGHYLLHFITAKRKGHGVHSPFVYDLCEEVFYNTHTFYDFERLNDLRNELLKNETAIDVEDLGAGSKVFKQKRRKISEIAQKGISTQKQARLIYLLINYLKCDNCIELGTSLGLTTLYLAAANGSGKVYSLEGSKTLYELAKKNAAKQGVLNCEFIHGHFNDALPPLLNRLPYFDLMYIDGNHSYSATLDYFNLALTKKTANSVLIFDDIYWSKGMTLAWEEIKQNAEVKLSIDCFYFGLVFFKEEFKEKQGLRLWI